MKLSELLSVIGSAERIRLFGKDQKEPFFTEYKGNIDLLRDHGEFIEDDPEVVRLQAHPEIKHREYKERGLLPPFEPDITRQYEFKDLTLFLYYDIFLE